jgi:hypothetical protein
LVSIENNVEAAGFKPNENCDNGCGLVFLLFANADPGWSVLDPVRLLSVVIQTSASVFNWARCL